MDPQKEFFFAKNFVEPLRTRYSENREFNCSVHLGKPFGV